MTSTARLALPDRTSTTRVIAVLRAARADDYADVIAALVAGGVRSIELTLSTPGTFEAFAGLLDRFGAEADLGIGTVTTVAEAARAVEAGAAYIVTPVTDEAVIGTALAAGVPIVPGGLTPTELHRSWRLGVPAVKVFPASQVSPGYAADLRGPFPDLQLVPSGGIDESAAAAWIAAGAAAVSVGGPMLGDAFRGGDLGALRERASRFAEIAR